GAVDASTLFKLPRNGLEVAHEQPRAERYEKGRIGENQRPRRVAQLKVTDDIGERNEQKRLRHEIGDENTGAEAAGERELQARKRIDGKNTAEQGDQCGNDGDEQRVENPTRGHGLGQEVHDVDE